MGYANLLGKMNWARMESVTGGTGALTLTDVAGYRNFRQAVDAVTGTFPVDYVIVASNGMRETGSGVYNAATNVLTRGSIADAFVPGSGNSAVAVTLPTSGVVVGFDHRVQDTLEIVASMAALATSIAAKADAAATTTALAAKADAAATTSALATKADASAMTTALAAKADASALADEVADRSAAIVALGAYIDTGLADKADAPITMADVTDLVVVAVALDEVVLGGAPGNPGVPHTPAALLAKQKVERSKTWQQTLVAMATSLTIATDLGRCAIPVEMNGMNLVGVQFDTPGGAGTGTGLTSFQVTRIRAGASVSVLSAVASIAPTKLNTTETGGAVGTINTSNDDAATGDYFRVDCTAITGTLAAKGLIATLTFRLP